MLFIENTSSLLQKRPSIWSPIIQNDLICAVEEWIQEKILEEVREAKFFSVCAEEAADSLNKEQLSLVLRFVDKTDVVREEFISFLLCEFGTTGEALSKIIITPLSKYALGVQYCRGQSYDGAGNIGEKYEVLRLKSPKGSIFALRSSCIKLMHCCSVYRRPSNYKYAWDYARNLSFF